MKINAKIPERHEAPPPKKPKAGDIAPDGSIYLGYHKGKYWYVTAEDAKGESGNTLAVTFNDASRVVKKLSAHGQKDWMLPPKDILDKMLKYKDAGAFNGTYKVRSAYAYWAESDGVDIWMRHFDHYVSIRSIANTVFYTTDDDYKGHVRAVRSVKKRHEP